MKEQRMMRVAMWLSLVLSVSSAASAQEVDVAPTQAPSLTSADPTVRIEAIRQMGAAPDGTTVATLVQVTRTDPVPEVRGWAVRTLHQIGSPAALAAVSAAGRQDPDLRVRAMARELTGAPPEPSPAAATPTAAPTQPQAQPQPQVVVVQQPAPVPAPPPRRVREPGRGLRRGGWITFGITYGIAALFGIGFISSTDDELRDLGWMALPVFGPGVASAVHNWDGEDEARAAGVWFWMWSAAQAAAVIMFSVGYGRRAAWRRTQGTRASRLQLAFAPTGPDGSPGMSLGGTF